MKAQNKIFAGLVLVLGLLGACAQQGTRPADLSTDIKGADTKAEHLALAAQYEQAAKDADAKVAEAQKARGQWQEHRFLDPKHAENTQEYYDALIFHYQEIAKANRNLAKTQQAIAAGL